MIHSERKSVEVSYTIKAVIEVPESLKFDIIYKYPVCIRKPYFMEIPSIPQSVTRLEDVVTSFWCFDGGLLSWTARADQSIAFPDQKINISMEADCSLMTSPKKVLFRTYIFRSVKVKCKNQVDHQLRKFALHEAWVKLCEVKGELANYGPFTIELKDLDSCHVMPSGSSPLHECVHEIVVELDLGFMNSILRSRMPLRVYSLDGRRYTKIKISPPSYAPSDYSHSASTSSLSTSPKKKA